MITATLACLSIPIIFSKYNKSIPFITYLGKQTLGIYVIQSIVINYSIKCLKEINGITSLDSIMFISLVFTISLALSFISNEVLKRIPIVRNIFLGVQRHNKSN